MAKILLEALEKRFGPVQAVKNLNLEISDKEFVVLVGPSGCGKTTVLRVIAGLEAPTSGDVYFDGALVTNVPPKDRDVGMVFQNYALFPHLNVFENMSFGLKLRKYPRPEIQRRVRDAATLLEIEDLLERKPGQLSGGQRQRVAVGRAIARRPKVFLFDEPLSNLDAKMRVQMRAEFQKLYQRTETTFVYVTHDQIEAMTLASRIVVMKDGEIQQVGDPFDVFERPVNMFVAGFLGSPSMNFFKCKLLRSESGLTLQDSQLNLLCPERFFPALEAYREEEVVLGVRPEHIYVSPEEGSGSRGPDLTAKIEVAELTGTATYLLLAAGQVRFICMVAAKHRFHSGDRVNLWLDRENLHLFSAATGNALGLQG
jgi:multiple sugar transport system ATP-binding protein